MISDNKEIRLLLEKAKTIAIIGCSPDQYRTSNYVAGYMQDKGYRVIPVNPSAEEIKGEKCYDSLSDIPHDIQIDIVNVFRNSRYAAEALEEVVQWKEETGQSPLVWTQLDVSSPESEEIAAKYDLPYVRNRCIMSDYDRFNQ